jgi:hypothetical protein
MNGSLNEPGDPRDMAGAHGSKAKGRIGAPLPPPVFPPGGRRSRMRHGLGPDSSRGSSGEGRSTVWSNTSAWVRAGLGAALILPDDPIPPRSDRLVAAEVARTLDLEAPADPGGESADELDLDDVVVTGIGDDPHLSVADLLYAWDPHVTELLAAVRRLATELEQQGEAALVAGPRMTHLERQLRAYCVGFLAGRRAADSTA